MVLSRRRLSLLVGLFLTSASGAWAASTYQTNFKNVYCNPASQCNVYWPEDETSGTTIHDVCNVPCGVHVGNYNLTSVNTPTLNQPGANSNHGASILWTAASTQYATGNQNDTGTGPGDVNSNFSVGCWAKFNSAAVAETLVSTGASNTTATDQGIWSLNNGGGVATFRLNQPPADGNATYMVATGATSLVDATWYFIVGVFRTTPTVTVYVNAVQDGTSSATTGNDPDAVQWMSLSRRNTTSPQYMDGYTSDCFIVKTAVSLAELKFLYDSPTDNWPYTVKAPVLPHHRDDGWEEKLVSRGYVTGHFIGKALRPNIFGPYLSLAAMLSGNAK